MTSPDTLSTRFPRPERNAVLLGLRPAQVLLLLAALGVATLSFVADMPPLLRLGGVTLAASCLVVAFGRAEELSLYRWMALRGAHIWRSLRDQQSYRARVLEPRQHGRLQLPGESGTLRFMTTASGLGVVHDPRRRRLVAVARIE